jgi:hypothetical protein
MLIIMSTPDTCPGAGGQISMTVYATDSPPTALVESSGSEDVFFCKGDDAPVTPARAEDSAFEEKAVLAHVEW